MATTILVEATPWGLDGVPVPVRLAGGGSRGYAHRGHDDWRAGVVALPRYTSAIGWDADGWTGGAIPQTGAINVAPSRGEVVTDLAGLVWPGAPITISTGDDALAEPVWATELAGTVAGISVKSGLISLTMSDLSGALADPVLTARFAGTGGAEGGDEAKDRIKRRSWGRCFNVEGRVIDKAYNVWEFGDPAFPLQGFANVKDRGRPTPSLLLMPWAGSIAATFAALRASAPPPGGAVIAPSIACVKWWTQPSGPLTADVLGEIGGGYVDTAAEIAARIVQAKSALLVSNVGPMALARPGEAGIHIDNEGETAAMALDRLLFGVSLVWVLDPAGVVQLLPISFDDPVEDIAAIEIEREAAYKPVGARLLGYQRNHRIHTDAEISAVYQASDGTYADGTPIEDLQPGAPGATPGAPSGTDIGGVLDPVSGEQTGGVPAGDLADDYRLFIPTLFDLIHTVGILNSYTQARTTLDGKQIGTVIVEVRAVTESTIEELHLLGAKNGDATAFVLNLETVMTGPTESLAQRFDSITASVDDVTAGVTFLMAATVTPAGGLSKFILGVDVDGRVGAIIGTSDGELAVLDLSWDAYKLRRPDGSLLLYTEGGVVKIPNAEIDRLKVNTAVVPVRATATSSVSGDGNPHEVGGGTWQTVLSVSVTLPVAGWIEGMFQASQGFGSGDQVWGFRMRVGASDEIGAAEGGRTQDSVPLFGSKQVSAGTYTISVDWYGHSSVTLGQRTMFVKGFPWSE